MERAGVPGNPPEPCLTRIGDKLPQSYAWQTLRETGATVAFSSDWPVSPLDPFLGIQSAMTSVPLSPESKPQAQSLMDTLDSFTAPRDMFGADTFSFTKTKHLGSNRARLSQIVNGKWTALSDYITE